MSEIISRALALFCRAHVTGRPDRYPLYDM